MSDRLTTRPGEEIRLNTDTPPSLHWYSASAVGGAGRCSLMLVMGLDELRSLKRLCERGIAAELQRQLDANDADAAVDGAVERIIAETKP